MADAPVWPRVVKLATPVTFGDETISELTFQRGKLGIMKSIVVRSEVPIADLIFIASKLSAQPTQVIELLDVDDMGEVMSIALYFYGKFLPGTTQ